MPLSLGQGSGDFAETSGRIQAFHVGIRNTVGILAADAFTQANPLVTTAGTISTTLSGITQVGVLGASIAFTRPDAGNGFIGGPAGTPYTGRRPLGIFINDANGNAFENTPGVASGRGSYFCGLGTYGVSIWETEDLTGGATLTYAVGDRLAASLNGYLTNLIEADNLVENSATAFTLLGIVKVAPDADNSLLVFDLRV
jgi:hypothetical protein